MTTGVNLHICHTVISLDVGGLEKIVLDMTRESHRRGHRVSIICTERTGKLAESLSSTQVEVHCLQRQSKQSLVDQAREILQELNPDVVHGHQIGATWHVGRAARTLKIPVIHTEHGNVLARAGSILTRWKLRYLLFRCGCIVEKFCCVSSEIACSVQKHGIILQNKCQLVNNGVSTDNIANLQSRDSIRAMWNIPSDALLIGTVGRLVEVKRQDRLIRALARLRSTYPNLYLILIGDGPEREYLQKLSLELQIQDRVRFPGYLPDPARLLHALDIFALSSRSEGLPVSLLEAWLSGLPVVCTAVGAIPDTVQNGHDGLLIQESSKEELISALDRLLAKPEERITMGQAGREKVLAGYSLNSMVDVYESIYRSSLIGRGQ